LVDSINRDPNVAASSISQNMNTSIWAGSVRDHPELEIIASDDINKIAKPRVKSRFSTSGKLKGLAAHLAKITNETIKDADTKACRSCILSVRDAAKTAHIATVRRIYDRHCGGNHLIALELDRIFAKAEYLGA
jgi:hypothetical protein